MIRWDELKKAPRIRQGKRKSIEWDKLKKMPAVPVDTSAGMYNNPSRQQSRSQSTAQSDFADWQPSFGFQNLGARENYLQRASSGAVPETAAQKFLPELYDRGFGGYGSPSGSGSGGEWENEPILTGEAMDTALSILAGAYGIKLDMDRAGQDVYMPKLSPAGLTAPMKMSLDNHQIMDYDEDNMRQLPYETAPGKSPSQGTVGWGAVSDYLGKSAKQIILGSGTEDVTALGTVGQIGLSFTGADLPMDARDLYYDLTHWDGTLEHSIQTGLDALAFIPVIGTLKYGDEAWDLVKAALKKLDEFTDIGKSADKGLDFAGELEKTILKNTDEATDATGSAFKASTEGAGDAGKIPWDSWQGYEKVTQNGKTYANVGNRLYSEHAVNRMQPSGNRFGINIYEGLNGEDYGRSIAPQYVEDVINSVKPVFQPRTGNYSYALGNVEVIVNPQGAVVTILTYK